MRTTSAPRRLAQAEVDERRRDDLLLQMQPGAQLDLAADAERVDPLIAGRRRGARAEDLPPVRLRVPRLTRARAARPARARSARACRRRRDPPRPARRARGASQRREELAGRRRAARARRRAGDNQVGGAVVVEIGGQEPRGARLQPWRWSTRVSAVASTRRRGVARQPRHRAVPPEHEQIEQRVAALFRGRDRDGTSEVGAAASRLGSRRRAGSRRRGTAPASSRKAASGTPSPSKSAQAKPRARVTRANGSRAANVPSPLLRSTTGWPSRGASTRSRSPSVSMSAGHTP